LKTKYEAISVLATDADIASLFVIKIFFYIAKLIQSETRKNYHDHDS
jgi:hypothetical protein